MLVWLTLRCCVQSCHGGTLFYMLCHDANLFHFVTLFTICGSRNAWCRMLLARSQMMHIFTHARRLSLALHFLHLSLPAVSSDLSPSISFMSQPSALKICRGLTRFQTTSLSEAQPAASPCMLVAWSCFLVLVPEVSTISTGH